MAVWGSEDDMEGHDGDGNVYMPARGDDMVTFLIARRATATDSSQSEPRVGLVDNRFLAVEDLGEEVGIEDG